MTGNDVTQAELLHAEHFLELAENSDLGVRTEVLVRRSDLIRLLAWYGKIVETG